MLHCADSKQLFTVVDVVFWNSFVMGLVSTLTPNHAAYVGWRTEVIVRGFGTINDPFTLHAVCSSLDEPIFFWGSLESVFNYTFDSFIIFFSRFAFIF